MFHQNRASCIPTDILEEPRSLFCNYHMATSSIWRPYYERIVKTVKTMDHITDNGDIPLQSPFHHVVTHDLQF